MNKAQGQLLALVVLIGLPIYGIAQLGDSIGWGVLVGVVVGAIALFIWYAHEQEKKRRAYLMQKYQDSKLVDDIMSKSFWQGQTSEQLFDALGKPHDIDQKVLKTKKKEIWKYDHQGGNRYALRITLDNDIVVGWDNKT